MSAARLALSSSTSSVVRATVSASLVSTSVGLRALSALLTLLFPTSMAETAATHATMVSMATTPPNSVKLALTHAKIVLTHRPNAHSANKMLSKSFTSKISAWLSAHPTTMSTLMRAITFACPVTKIA